MRLWAVFIKTWREMLRDPWSLGLTLVFAPLFILLYWVFTQGGSTAYTVLVLNQDRGAENSDGAAFNAGEQAIQAIEAVRYADDRPLLKVKRIDDLDEAEEILREREAAAFLIIPDGFSEAIASRQSGGETESATIIFGGDLTNPYYTLAATLALGAVEGYTGGAASQVPFLQFSEQPLGASLTRTEFEIYTPGILIFSVTMLIFLASMTIAREIETGTLRRLQITPLTSFDYLGGVTLALVLLGTLAVVLTFATALAVGFHSQGPLWLAALVGALTSLAIVGCGMIVACFARSVSQAFVIANFPLGLFMFFSGIIFPIQKLVIFRLGEFELGLFDILPPTHAVAALNKILTLGVGVRDVLYELIALAFLSVLYFILGVRLFQRMRLSGYA